MTDESGSPYPVYDVLAAVASLTDAEVLDIALRDPLAVEALALRSGPRLLVLLANLTPDHREVTVALPIGPSRTIDVGPYGIARIDVG